MPAGGRPLRCRPRPSTRSATVQNQETTCRVRIVADRYKYDHRRSSGAGVDFLITASVLGCSGGRWHRHRVPRPVPHRGLRPSRIPVSPVQHGGVHRLTPDEAARATRRLPSTSPSKGAPSRHLDLKTSSRSRATGRPEPKDDLQRRAGRSPRQGLSTRRTPATEGARRLVANRYRYATGRLTETATSKVTAQLRAPAADLRAGTTPAGCQAARAPGAGEGRASATEEAIGQDKPACSPQRTPVALSRSYRCSRNRRPPTDQRRRRWAVPGRRRTVAAYGGRSDAGNYCPGPAGRSPTSAQCPGTPCASSAPPHRVHAGLRVSVATVRA